MGSHTAISYTYFSPIKKDMGKNGTTYSYPIMTQHPTLHICDLCKSEFVNKQKLSVHRKGRGIRCASKQEVANSVISQGSKRASSPDAALHTDSQRRRISEAPDVDVGAIDVIDTPEAPGLEYRIINDDESEQKSCRAANKN